MPRMPLLLHRIPSDAGKACEAKWQTHIYNIQCIKFQGKFRAFRMQKSTSEEHVDTSDCQENINCVSTSNILHDSGDNEIAEARCEFIFLRLSQYGV
jgi:hypothetical protein